MYDALTTRYTFACPSRGETRVSLSAFRSIDRLPGAAHPAVFHVLFDCHCGEEHPGLVSDAELDWAPLGLSEERFLNLMTARFDETAAELSDLAVRRIQAGDWPWSFYCYPEDRPRPVFPSSFFLLAPGDGSLGLAVRCPACGRVSVNPRLAGARRSPVPQRPRDRRRSPRIPGRCRTAAGRVQGRTGCGRVRRPPAAAGLKTLPGGQDRGGGGSVYGLTRAATTLIGMLAAGLLLWLGTQILPDSGDATSGEYWAAFGLVAAAGLTMALSQLLGGWTKWGWPRVSGNVFLFGFLPTLILGGWVLAAGEPGEHWIGRHVRSWSGDIGIDGFVGDLKIMVPAIAFGIGLVFGFTFDTTGPRVGRRATPAPGRAVEPRQTAGDGSDGSGDDRRVHIREGEAPAQPETEPAPRSGGPPKE